jgi:hypothetical protein
VILIGSLREPRSGETRVAATAATVTQLAKLGSQVVVEPGAGMASRQESSAVQAGARDRDHRGGRPRCAGHFRHAHAEALENADGGLALRAVLGRFLGGEGEDLLKVVGSFRSARSPLSPGVDITPEQLERLRDGDQ